jgi:hypothetical protein
MKKLSVRCCRCCFVGGRRWRARAAFLLALWLTAAANDEPASTAGVPASTWVPASLACPHPPACPPGNAGMVASVTRDGARGCQWGPCPPTILCWKFCWKTPKIYPNWSFNFEYLPICPPPSKILFNCPPPNYIPSSVLEHDCIAHQSTQSPNLLKFSWVQHS